MKLDKTYKRLYLRKRLSFVRMNAVKIMQNNSKIDNVRQHVDFQLPTQPMLIIKKNTHTHTQINTTE